MGRNLARTAREVIGLDPLGGAHIFRATAAQRELTELERVGTIAGGLARRDELVGGGHRVVDDGGEFQEHVLLHRIHRGPVLDVRAVAELLGEVGLAVAVVDAALVDAVVEGVRLVGVFVLDVRRGGEHAAVRRGGGDGAGVHQGNEGDLSLARLGTFTVREVAGGVADGEAVVGGHVAGAEARAAEGGLDDHAGLEEFLGDVVAGRGEVHRGGLRVAAHREVVIADVLALEDGRSLGEVVVGTAGAAGDEGLVGDDLAVLDLGHEVHLDLVAEALAGVFLDLLEDAFRIGLELVDRVGVRRVEREGDHALLGAQVDADHAVVVRDLAGLELLVGLGTLVDVEVFLDLLVGDPDGAEAGGLGGHHVDAVAEVDREVLDAGAGELEHLVLDETALEGGLHQGDGDIVRAHAVARLAFQPHEDDLGGVDVPGVAEELLHELAAAFAHAHVTQRAVARVGVGAQDHVAAGGEGLAGILVDNGLIGRNIDTAVLLRGGEAEHVVVLIDGTAHRAQGVVAVGHRVRERELVETAGARRLDNAHVGDVVGNHRIETDAHFLALAAVDVVGTENSVGDRVFAGLVRGRLSGGIGDDRLAVQEIHTMRNQFYHNCVGFKS